MPANPSIPLAALLVTAGFLAAGFAAHASALDQRIHAFVPVDASPALAVVDAVGESDGDAIDRLHLSVEVASGASADVSELAVEDEHGALAILELRGVRDADDSLDGDRLDDRDLARVTVELATPMDAGEERHLRIDLGEHGRATELVVTAPAALDDGYTRLDVEHR